MTPIKKNILIFAGLAIICLTILFGVVMNFRTDPTPPEVLAGWYLPDQDIVWTIPGNGTDKALTEHLVISGKMAGPAPQFPKLSPYSRYVNYSYHNTGDWYVIATWFFNDEESFLTSEKQLKEFLVSSGTVTDIVLDFSGSPAGDRAIISYNNDLLPPDLMTTGYESANTSGLFFTVGISGSDMEPARQQSYGDIGYYIVYYGTAEPADLASQRDFLTSLIGHTYSFDRVVFAGPLVI